MKFIDMSGERINKVSVLWPAGRKTVTGRSRIVYACQCDCGRILHILGTQIKRYTTCGCSRKGKARHLKHGHARGSKRSPELGAWTGARNRCTNSKCKAYPNYGGRGIQFRFSSFEEFLANVGLRPTPQHSLDRIDNNGNYEPGNVRWATRKEQANNRRKAKPPSIPRSPHTEATRLKMSLAKKGKPWTINRRLAQSV